MQCTVSVSYTHLDVYKRQWKRFVVGNVNMAGVKLCARCVMPTINQQTAEKGEEPLATLTSYRKVGQKVLFGQNVIPLQTGLIRVGDKIVVL